MLHSPFRQAKNGQNRLHLPHFYTGCREFAKKVSKSKVSVVIATYNYAQYVASSIKSVLDQTFGDLEVIVVDDGSKDHTEAVVRPFLEDDRVRYVKTENRRQPAAKNTGIELSRAPLVAFLDADDLWLPTKVAKQVAVYEADPDLGVVYCRRCLMDPEGQEVEFTQPVLYRGPVLESIFEDNFICFSSAIVSQRVFELVGLFDERRRQNSDYDLWVRAALHFRFDYVDEPLVWYRQGHASLKQGAETLLRSTLEIRSEFLDLHGGRALLSPRLIRRANALIYNNLGLAIRRSRPLHALTLFARSIAIHPASPEPWLGIVGIIPFSEPVRRPIRRLLGRRVNFKPRRTGRSLAIGLRPSSGQVAVQVGDGAPLEAQPRATSAGG